MPPYCLAMTVIITQGIPYQQLLDDVRALVRYEMSQNRPELLAAPVSEELLSIKAAAEMLKVSVATIHEYKRRGLLPYIKLAGRAFIRRSDVLAAGTLHKRSQKPARAK
jgi:hypothetical protein